jgi:4-hydroxy-tetrahydrodipicolinate synthase
VASNVVPRAFASMCRFLAAGEPGQAEALDQRLQALYDFLGVEPNPIPLKAILQRFGLGVGLRLPLLSLSAAHSGTADRITELCRDIESQLQ